MEFFTRMMRDLGFNFFHHDDYCENLFAKHFELNDSIVKKYDLVTAFEVLEHLDNPLEEIKKIFELGENFIFTTELIPEYFDENWIYIFTRNRTTYCILHQKIFRNHCEK